MILPWRKKKVLVAHEPKSRMANLGCGAHYHREWDNYDFAPASPAVKDLDLSKSLPFSDAVYEVCYTSHVLEHLPRERVPGLLAEILRILKPEGVLRIVVPDLEAIARLYLAELEAAAAGDPVAADRHEWMTLELFDQMTRSFSGGFMGRTMRSRPLPHRAFIESRIGWEGKNWLSAIDDAGDRESQAIACDEIYGVESIGGEAESSFRQSGEVHRWMYDRVSLARLLHASGFAGVQVCQAEESRITDFVSYRLDTDETGAVRKPDSLFIEASKPT
jgi:predicted SAM-dependent methyltransferase